MTPTPTDIKLLQKDRTLWVRFDDGKEATFSCAFLRENSPSAEMRHGTQVSAIDPHVNITQIEPIGNYAIKLYFDDGHKSGLYSWAYLYELRDKAL